MSDVPGIQRSSKEGDSEHARHVRKGSSHRTSFRSSRSQREVLQGGNNRPHGHVTGDGGDSASQHTRSLPSTSRDEASAPPWNMVMNALAALRGDVEKLKEESNLGPSRGADDAAAAADVNIGLSSQVVPPSRSPTGFSGFTPAEHYLSSDDCVSQNDGLPDSVLLQCARAYGPVDEVSDGIDQHVADMVNHVFAHGLREEEYKEILEDDAAKRPDNCHALAPVDCNLQVLDALKSDAKKADFRLKDVGRDIITAATILTVTHSVDKIAQTSQPDAAQEVGMLNGAQALLGHANHKNNLARRFIIKCEINKYAHLCSDKVPMTRLLFGDDVSLSATHIEESEKLRSKIAPRKPLSTSKFGPGKFRGSSGRLAIQGFYARFHPYGQRTHGPRSEHRQSFSRRGPETKNSRGRGQNPWQ
ncbi:LOW QUALITY PROTEIN: uncharacterized protein [Panulirus ornatus]|uniref:LOW QUALITY PROTEIN: uncharacterized protein n=1 Tax=Panulirus ornatus TaxID=150431 RepID=UPI003A89B31B